MNQSTLQVTIMKYIYKRFVKTFSLLWIFFTRKCTLTLFITCNFTWFHASVKWRKKYRKLNYCNTSNCRTFFKQRQVYCMLVILNTFRDTTQFPCTGIRKLRIYSYFSVFITEQMYDNIESCRYKYLPCNWNNLQFLKICVTVCITGFSSKSTHKLQVLSLQNP